jgi:hypothetical protein
MQRVLIGLGENRHGADAEFLAGANDAESDFPAIRDEDLSKHDDVRIRGTRGTG